MNLVLGAASGAGGLQAQRGEVQHGPVYKIRLVSKGAQMNTIGKHLPSHIELEVWLTELIKHRTITMGLCAR